MIPFVTDQVTVFNKINSELVTCVLLHEHSIRDVVELCIRPQHLGAWRLRFALLCSQNHVAGKHIQPALRGEPSRGGLVPAALHSKRLQIFPEVLVKYGPSVH